MLTPEVKVLSVVQNMEDGDENPPTADSSEEDEDDESQGVMTRLQSTVEATQVRHCPTQHWVSTTVAAMPGWVCN